MRSTSTITIHSALSVTTLSLLVLVLALLLQIPHVQSKEKATSFGSCSSACDEEPGMFCGIDGTCHEFSCQNYYQYADQKLTGRNDTANNGNSTLQCFGYSQGKKDFAHGVVYGCDPIFPFVLTTPGKQVTEPFNYKCIAPPRDGGFEFECYEFMPSDTATNFDFFEREAESSFPDCGDKQPKYFYMIASSNHYAGVEGLQGNPIVVSGADKDGDTIWQTNSGNTFDRDIALRAMYANVVGGPGPASTTGNIQVGSLGGRNPLKNPRPNHERTEPDKSGVATTITATTTVAASGLVTALVLQGLAAVFL